jgi:IS66 Orf2 like protein
MAFLGENAKIIVYDKPVNMFKGFDSLLSIVVTELNIKLGSNIYVLFVNRDRNRLKILFFENGHISIFAMRLSGAMCVNFGVLREFDHHEFYELITNLKTKKFRNRYGINCQK